MTTKQALFIGAHPDDIEIGAGGTVAKLAASGWEVWICPLTSELNETIAEMRSAEARQAATKMGVPVDRVITPHFRDGDLHCNAETVSALRQLVSQHKITPSLVFTHCADDSHNDHRAANEITVSTFRGQSILTYPVVNSLLTSFAPHVFIDVSNSWDAKIAALTAHSSQAGRIKWEAINLVAETLGKRLARNKVEAYGLIFQEGSHNSWSTIQAINDCPFNTFWASIIKTEPLFLVHAVPVQRERPDSRWSIDKDRDGISLLRRSFSEMWIGNDPIREYSCKEQTAYEFLSNESDNNVLLSGGAVSNDLTRTYFNHLVNIRYAIGYSMPGYKDIRIEDRVLRSQLNAQYELRSPNNRSVTRDSGILTIMRNPSNESRWLLGCMGIHGFGSLACFEVLSSRDHLQEVNEKLFTVDRGFQVLVDYHVKSNNTAVDWSTFQAM